MNNASPQLSMPRGADSAIAVGLRGLLRLGSAAGIAAGIAVCFLPVGVQAQPAALTDKLVGDVGGAAYISQGLIRSKTTDTSALPYGYFDYGRFFARVDTLGLKVVPVGDGYLELAGRISQGGWRANTPALAGLTDRKTPIPLGLGTFQKTPYGAFFLNAFVDEIGRAHV